MQLRTASCDGSSSHAVETLSSTPPRQGCCSPTRPRASTDPAGPGANYVPALYVGSDGKPARPVPRPKIKPRIKLVRKVTDGRLAPRRAGALGTAPGHYLDDQLVGTKPDGALVLTKARTFTPAPGSSRPPGPASPPTRPGTFSGARRARGLRRTLLTTDRRSTSPIPQDIATRGRSGAHESWRSTRAATPSSTNSTRSTADGHRLDGRIGRHDSYGLRPERLLKPVTDPDDHNHADAQRQRRQRGDHPDLPRATSCPGLVPRPTTRTPATRRTRATNKVTATGDARASSEADACMRPHVYQTKKKTNKDT